MRWRTTGGPFSPLTPQLTTSYSLFSYFLLAGILMPRGTHRAHDSRAQKNYRDRDHPMLWEMCEMANIHHTRNQDDGSQQIKSERHWRLSRQDFCFNFGPATSMRFSALASPGSFRTNSLMLWCRQAMVEAVFLGRKRL